MSLAAKCTCGLFIPYCNGKGQCPQVQMPVKCYGCVQKNERIKELENALAVSIPVLRKLLAVAKLDMGVKVADKIILLIKKS